MCDWQPMDTAPKEVDIIVFNAVTGAYRSRFEDGEYPLRTKDGVHYPVPTKWMSVYSCDSEFN